MAILAIVCLKENQLNMTLYEFVNYFLQICFYLTLFYLLRLQMNVSPGYETALSETHFRCYFCHKIVKLKSFLST